MRHLTSVIISATIATASFSTAATQPLWLRDATISPDAGWIAFTYAGDLYKVPANGGNAIRLTSSPAYDERPVWSPDGKKIAFASDRNGSADIYIMDADGGKASRLTSYSGAEYPTAFTPDGKSVLFNSAIQDDYRSALFPKQALTELYSVPTDGGRISQILSTPAEAVSFIPGRQAFLYQDVKGVESEWRKHHTSSVTRDIWMYDPATGHHTNLTCHAGEDRNPVVAHDGKTVYILSERDGKSMNVCSLDIDNPSEVKPLTSFTTHPVRFLSAANDGTLAFTYNGRLYTMRPGAKPARLDINLNLDIDTPVRRLKVSASEGATPSPDGKQVAFTYRGEVFVTATDYNTTKQITSTPAAESDIDWNPDNRTIAYTSERDGHYNIYTATIARDDEPNFANATVIDEKPLFNDSHDRQQPKYSPDGKKMAYILDRQKLMVIDLDSKKVSQLTDGTTNPERDGDFNFDWSPDGKWIAFELTGNGHEPYADIAIVNTTGKPVVHNLTRSAYFDMNPKWALDGNAIVFESDRYGMRNHASWGSQSDVMILFMNHDAYDRFRLSKEDYELLQELEKQQKDDKAKADKKYGKKDEKKKETQNTDSTAGKDINIEFDRIGNRLARLTPYSGSTRDFIVTADGETLYYLFSTGQKDDLWKLDLRKREPSVAARIGANGRHLALADKGKELFILGANGMTKMSVKSEKTTPISYSASMTLDPAAERQYMFNHVRQEVLNRFYEKSLHGVDWKAMTDNYATFLPHIHNNYDFAEMLSELLGELNVSHTGGRYYPSGNALRTASLGLLYDWDYKGKGIRVAEIVKDGPFDHANTSMRPGAVITSVNRTPVTPDVDITVLLADLAGKKTLIEFDCDGKTVEEVVLPVSTATFNSLLYKRWIRQREADVDSLSGGRLGYVHLPQMDDAAFRQIYIDLLGKYVDREGVVIDTRFNGGGRLHEDIEVLFSGDKYLTQVIRGQDICDMPSRRWNKPSIMLQCEANYSNAHGTPWVYSHKKLGTLVGAPVPGTMTSVNWETLQDPSLVYGIPVIGYRTDKGNYLENTQLEPDILVLNDPADIVKGKDTQLKVAVETLLRQIDSKKKP